MYFNSLDPLQQHVPLDPHGVVGAELLTAEAADAVALVDLRGTEDGLGLGLGHVFLILFFYILSDRFLRFNIPNFI